jgi:CO/xanthine dehydrogenase Mo-binding subunit
MSTGFARDYLMRGAIAATAAGKILAVSVDVIADHGAFNAAAQPSKYPAGFFNVFTGSYDLAAAHCHVTGAYTNKAPGGWRTRARFASPRPCTWSSGWSIASPTSLVEILLSCG